MLPYRQHGTKELAQGYATAARLAEERRQLCEESGIKDEAKQWGKVATYCRVMAKYRLLDEPNPRVNHEVPMAPDAVQALIAKQAMEEDAWYRGWDGESIPPNDPRRPMRAERRFALAAAMQVLTDQERVAAIMYWGWKLPKGLIAEAMEVKPKVIDLYLARAKAKFKRINAEDDYFSRTMRAAEDRIGRTREL